MDNLINSTKKLINIYVLIFISVILSIIVIPNFFQTQFRTLNLILWIIIFLCARRVENQHNRFKAQKEELKTIFLIVTIYLIGYYLSGLVFNFQKSIYDHSFYGILYNFTFFISIIFLKEYTRSRLLNNTRSAITLIFVTILFIILDFNYVNILDNFRTGETAFKYIAGVVYPTILRGILCSFLVKKGSYKLSLMFIMPIIAIQYLTPVVPNIDWFVTIAFESALVILIYYFINYEYLISTERFTRYEIKNGNPKSSIPVVLFVLAFTFFIAGLFPIRPVALLSNSMKPYIKRGDVVLVKKVNHDQIKNICIGDVVEYKVDDKIVIHRVTNITKKSGGELFFTTKGDANNTEDPKLVAESQIVGIAKNYIPYAGYPSVLFSEKILKIKSSD